MSCSFATSCWEGDWEHVLCKKDYLKKLQIENHFYQFAERLLIINNVQDVDAVKKAADLHVKEGTITRYVIAKEEVLDFFGLKRSDFRLGEDAANYGVTSPDWIYYNALGPLNAIYEATSDYLLYHTGDVFLKEPVKWIEKAMRRMERDPKIGVANLIWNDRYKEAKEESYRRSWNFFYAKEGFSDQQFLVKRDVFRKPIYGEIRHDSAHYPRGDVFEKRVFSFLKNRGLKRIIFRGGSYTHENI